MRHNLAHRKLGRVTEHRLALLRNQAIALLRHERIETTMPKAKELRPIVAAYRNSDTFRKIVDGLWQALQKAWDWILKVQAGAWQLAQLAR